jgi:hypothetical protein
VSSCQPDGAATGGLTRRQLAQAAVAALAAGGLPAAWRPALAQAQAQGPATAQRHALLVGVSEYPVSQGTPNPFHLHGPKNDVQLLRGLLQQRGFAPAQITTLADDVPGAQLPTRAAILGALDALAARARAGDFVFLYFAGHGSQMPADPRTAEGRAESDGLHEIFLPRDVGPWNGNTGRVENAIVDFELNRRLDALLARQAFVWAVFDACHSATLMRSAGDPDVRYRYVDPALLGVPSGSTAGQRVPAEEDSLGLGRVQPPRTRGAPTGAGTASASPGGYVAFYAAQTTQTTPEMRLPLGDPNRKSYGLFGYSLAEALANVEGVTYRQLSQYLLQRYGAQGLFTPTPLFTGTHLDAPVFGSQAGAAVRQWPLRVERGVATLRAGLLSQLEVGTVLAVLPSALAPTSQALGQVRVSAADVMSATVVPVAGSAMDVAKLPAEAVVRAMQAPAPNFRLRVLVGPSSAKASAAEQAAVARAVAELQAEPRSGIELAWVKPGEAHDVRLHVEAAQLWLVPPSSQFYAQGPHKTPSIRIAQPEFKAKLAENLQHMGRALNLLRMASLLQDLPSAQRALQVEARLKPKAGPERALDLASQPQLADGDVVTLRLRNPGRTALDLTALYIDAGYGVTALFPHQSGASNRIEAGGSEEIQVAINVETTGIERLLLIAVEARSQAERHDFSFLQQPRMETTRAGLSDYASLFAEAGFGAPEGQATRGARSVPSPERLDMRVLAVRVR